MPRCPCDAHQEHYAAQRQAAADAPTLGDLLADLLVAMVWRPIGWDVPLTRPAGHPRVWHGQYSRLARRWVRV